MRLLLAEDDPELGLALCTGLRRSGIPVDWKRRGADALAIFDSRIHQALVLDLGLPDLDGFEVLHRLRQLNLDVPVVVVSGRGAIEDRIRGLEVGADDYITKPFELVELIARLRAIQRRVERQNPPTMRVGDVLVDVRSHSVFLDHAPVTLSAREFLTLRLLVGSPWGLSRGRIARCLQSLGDDVDECVVQCHVDALQKKLRLDLVRTADGWRCLATPTVH